MQRKLSLGGLFLLFLLLCIITSCIHPHTTSTEDTIPGAEDIISSTEGIICTEDIISFTENAISTEDTTRAEDTICTAIIDGDTFKLKNGETVRLIGIDAPELSQPGGEESRQYLTQLILNKGVTLKKGYEDRDKYRRLLRFVFLGDVCINEEMIIQGYAEARYLSPKDPLCEYYIQLEIEAEITKAGLWNANIFQPRSQLNWDHDIPVITWSDAHNYYNQYVVVEGTIVNTYNSGNVCFLNFHRDYQYFTAVIFASDFPGFPFIPEVFYLNKRVQIMGIIKEYNGSPEIIVKTPDQITLLDQKQSKILNLFFFFLFIFLA
jgi:micrococcal nuclease